MPPLKPPTDVLSKLIAQLQQQVGSHGNGRGRRLAKRASGRAANSGTVSFEAYLTQRIERAIAPLRPLLAPSDVRFIGAMLRECLAMDPNLSRLVERLARASPTSRSSR